MSAARQPARSPLQYASFSLKKKFGEQESAHQQRPGITPWPAAAPLAFSRGQERIRADSPIVLIDNCDVDEGSQAGARAPGTCRPTVRTGSHPPCHQCPFDCTTGPWRAERPCTAAWVASALPTTLRQAGSAGTGRHRRPAWSDYRKCRLAEAVKRQQLLNPKSRRLARGQCSILSSSL